MNSDEPLSKREQLEKAIAAQESLRGALDDAIVDAAVAALRKQLDELGHETAIEQQRKLATVLFVDVVGSTRLMRELDPEENLTIMDTALQRLAVPVEEHGGRVTRFMGDGYLAVFGLPRARENDPEMAVRAGLGILKTAQVIAQELEEEWNLGGFQVRVGVNTGLIVAGGITEAEGTVMGNAVNLAARLESSAPPGRLLISHHTYQHVRGIFDLEPGESIEVKGFADPVQVYLVEKAKPSAFRLMTRGIEGIETPMVGREGELKTLQEAIESVALDQDVRFVTVVGEAGMGKSRLLYEFENLLGLQHIPCVIFKGRATLETQGIPYGLLRNLIASRFGILDDDPISLVREKVVNGFREALGDAENLEMKAHFAGHLLGYHFRDSPFLRGVLDAPQQLHDRAIVYLTEYFKALSLNDPVVIFLDDIHWSDESSLDILPRLSHELSNLRVLFVALSRPSLFERRPSWGSEAFHQRLELRPLSPAESRRLIKEVLQKVRDVPDVMSDLIVQNAEGNPYYLEELIKMLVEDGVIVQGESEWRVHAERLVEVRIPPTLTGVIQARLDCLPEEEHTVLQQASVVGRVFWDAAVFYVNKNILSEKVGSKSGSLDIVQHLNALQSREMVFQNEASTFSDIAEYFFKHALLREVTYESVLKRTRRMYHGLVADWLIEHSGERAGEVSGLIAGHLEKAGKMDEALEYMCRAAENAVSNYAVDEAMDFHTRALALTPEEDMERRFKLLLGLELVLGMQGNRDAQRVALDSLEVIADSTSDARKKAEVLIRRAWFSYWSGEYQEMLMMARQAVDLAKRDDERDLAVKACYASAWAHLQQGDADRALVYAEEALPRARQLGNRRDEGNLLNTLGMISAAQGDYAAQRDYIQAFLDITREIGDLQLEVKALGNLGVALMLLGDYQAAEDYFQQDLSISREMGDRVYESTALVNLAWVASSQGEWELAVQYAEEGIASKREFEIVEVTAEGLIWLGHAWLGLGQPEKAMEAYQESLAIRRELNQPHLAMGVLAGMARAASAQGDLHKAQDHIEEIMTYLSEGGTLQGTWEPLRIYLTCYQVLQWVEDSRADDILERAFNFLQERAARIPEGEDRHRFLENVPWHREIMSLWEAHQGLE